MDSPKTRYYRDIQGGLILKDPAQEAIVGLLESLYHHLVSTKATPKKSWGFLRLTKQAKKLDPKGLYLWGDVGIGKTFLMDLLHHTLPPVGKMRFHFHGFMQMIHEALKKQQGVASPLDKIAAHLATKTRIIFLDEFIVEDIADAMILGNVLKALFESGIILMTTSNVAPDNLYEKGLQRNAFLPAIALIKQMMDVRHIGSLWDYRQEGGERQRGAYLYPHDEKVEGDLKKFMGLIEKENENIEIAGRPIYARAINATTGWLDFKAVASIPRSYRDYLSLVKRFNTLIITHIPTIAADDDATVTYLIHLLDVVYDSDVKIILTSDVAPDLLYPKGRKREAFERTLSRLKGLSSKI